LTCRFTPTFLTPLLLFFFLPFVQGRFLGLPPQFSATTPPLLDFGFFFGRAHFSGCLFVLLDLVFSEAMRAKGKFRSTSTPPGISLVLTDCVWDRFPCFSFFFFLQTPIYFADQRLRCVLVRPACSVPSGLHGLSLNVLGFP